MRKIAKPKTVARPSRRPRYPMPAFIKEALTEHRLMAAYRERPPYQQNDYIGWISRAKLAATRDKRLAQMIAELEGGKRYMRMAWRPVTGQEPQPRKRSAR
jgi:uncharacterized protein YdeI (YjbR/CyaY-like superfamily)